MSLDASMAIDYMVTIMENSGSDIEVEQSEKVDAVPISSPLLESKETLQFSADEDEDDDFGSFDEASFEEFQAPEEEPALKPTEITSKFLSSVFQDQELFLRNLDDLLDSILPHNQQPSSEEPAELLNAEASQRLKKLSQTPRLNPPNWIKLKIRHNLMVKLGVPINLDELESPGSANLKRPSIAHQRKRSINEQDIDWSLFVIPELETLEISPEKKQESITKTNEILSRIEEDNLKNTSQLFLESSSDASLDAKLAQLKANYKELIDLSSIWQDQLKELRSSQEVFESVVQNMVGYSQKLQRNEIIEQLQKTKGKKGKRTF